MAVCHVYCVQDSFLPIVSQARTTRSERYARFLKHAVCVVSTTSTHHYVAWTATVIYGAICAALFAFQRSLIYYPQPRSNEVGITLMTLPVGAESVLVSTRPNAGPNALIYFGGNAEDVSGHAGFYRCLPKRRDLSSRHYPGYGWQALASPLLQSISAAALSQNRVHTEQSMDCGGGIEVGRSLTQPASQFGSQACGPYHSWSSSHRMTA